MAMAPPIATTVGQITLISAENGVRVGCGNGRTHRCITRSWQALTWHVVGQVGSADVIGKIISQAAHQLLLEGLGFHVRGRRGTQGMALLNPDDEIQGFPLIGRLRLLPWATVQILPQGLIILSASSGTPCPAGGHEGRIVMRLFLMGNLPRTSHEPEPRFTHRRKPLDAGPPQRRWMALPGKQCDGGVLASRGGPIAWQPADKMRCAGEMGGPMFQNPNSGAKLIDAADLRAPSPFAAGKAGTSTLRGKSVGLACMPS